MRVCKQTVKLHLLVILGFDWDLEFTFQTIGIQYLWPISRTRKKKMLH